jgi:hypothetical protein
MTNGNVNSPEMYYIKVLIKKKSFISYIQLLFKYIWFKWILILINKPKLLGKYVFVKCKILSKIKKKCTL